MGTAGNDGRWRPWLPRYTRAPRRLSPGRAPWAPSALRRRGAGGPAPKSNGDAGSPAPRLNGAAGPPGRKAPDNNQTGVARNRQGLRAVAPVEGAAEAVRIELLRWRLSVLRKRGAAARSAFRLGVSMGPSAPD